MIRPTVKTPHTLASPTIKGVHVQVIRHLDRLQACSAFSEIPQCGVQPPHLKSCSALTKIIIDPRGKPRLPLICGSAFINFRAVICDSGGPEASKTVGVGNSMADTVLGILQSYPPLL